MDIKVINIKNDEEEFEEQIEELIKDGYEIKASNMTVLVEKQIVKWKKKIYITENNYYYALMQEGVLK